MQVILKDEVEQTGRRSEDGAWLIGADPLDEGWQPVREVLTHESGLARERRAKRRAVARPTRGHLVPDQEIHELQLRADVVGRLARPRFSLEPLRRVCPSRPRRGRPQELPIEVPRRIRWRRDTPWGVEKQPHVIRLGLGTGRRETRPQGLDRIEHRRLVEPGRNRRGRPAVEIAVEDLRKLVVDPGTERSDVHGSHP